MNKCFAPLFAYLAKIDLVATLIAQEERVNGSLADLAFAVEYDPEDHPGIGRVSIYRLSAGVGRAVVNAPLDNMQSKLWFVEDDVWRVERHTSAASVSRFFALVAYHPDYRPQVRVNFSKPLVNLHLQDLPALPQYPQRRVLRQQQSLALAV
jgi:hypothetical protein